MSITLAATLIVGLGMASQWIAWKRHWPAIVVLAAVGLIVGPGLEWLRPTEVLGEPLRAFVSMAVAVVLFEGGLRLKLSELHAAGAGVGRLCSIGLLLNWAITSAACVWVGGLSLATALTFGGILTVTGPTVIMPLLRTARLQRSTASLFKWEGIVNDPLGALLAVLVVEFFAFAELGGAAHVAKGMFVAVVGGGMLGWLGGLGIGWAFRHGKVPEYQKAPVLLAAVLVVTAAGNAMHHEAGLLATTVMGLVLGNLGLASIAQLTRFKEAIAVLLVSSVFIVLTADMDARVLLGLDRRHAALLACVLLVCRPAAVLLSFLGTDLPRNERLLLAFIAPRGVVAAAVAGVLGPRLVDAGIGDAELLVPLVFATVFLTVGLHGFALPHLARRFGLSAKAGDGLLIVGASPWTTELGRVLSEMDVPVVLADTGWTRLRRARLAGLTVHYGEVLSEGAEEELPMHEVSTVLAATDNDAYNSLVSVHFGPELGRDRAWQLPHQELDAKDARSAGPTIRGRFAFEEHATHWGLLLLLGAGWRFQRTKITDQYGFDEWKRDVWAAVDLPPTDQPPTADHAIPLLVVRDEGAVVLHGPRFPITPEPGDILLSFAPPRAPRRPEPKAEPEGDNKREPASGA